MIRLVPEFDTKSPIAIGNRHNWVPEEARFGVSIDVNVNRDGANSIFSNKRQQFLSCIDYGQSRSILS